MEFDPELVIRLHWRGLRIRNLPTRVVYRPGGLSHFDMIGDNARMTWVYTRSLGGMLVRLPRLLGRRLAAAPRDRVDERNELGRPAHESWRLSGRRRADSARAPDAAAGPRARAWAGGRPCARWTWIAASCSGMRRAACRPGSESSIWRSAWPSTERWSREPPGSAAALGLFIGGRRVTLRVDRFQPGQRLVVRRCGTCAATAAWWPSRVGSRTTRTARCWSEGRLNVYSVDRWTEPPRRAGSARDAS